MKSVRGGVAAAVGLLVLAVPGGARAFSSSLGLSGRATVGDIGIRLVDAPDSAAGDPRAQVYIVDHLAPGTKIHRRIEVSNTADSSMRVRLYASAATIADGVFVGGSSDSVNDLSKWTTIDSAVIELGAGDVSTSMVTIAVPVDAPPGEQYGVVWAEVRSDPVSGGGLVEASRAGIRLYVSVGPGGAPAADFTIDSLTATRSNDGDPTVVAVVRNSGGRALDMSGTLELLSGPGGLRAGPFPAALGTTLAIGDTEAVTFALDVLLPDGPWDAQLVLHSGLVEREAHATIRFPSAGAPPAIVVPANPTSASAFSELRGWTGPSILVLSLALGVTGVAVRRLRHGRRVHRTSPDGPPA